MNQRPRLAIGPANYAGQAHAWARAVAANLPVDAWSFTRGPVRRGEFMFDADRRVPAALYYLPLAKMPRFGRFLRGTTHVALDGFQTLYSWYRKGNAAADAHRLAERGIHAALIAHGSEVRDPAAHQQRNEFSLFSAGDDDWRTGLSVLAAANRAAAQRSGLPLFVSTPDLLNDLPTATWLPLCVELSRWRCERPIFADPVPTVLHLPSKRYPPIKGTQYVEPACLELERKGLIRYVSPDAVPHARVPELVASADIVIDQLLAASYGVAAVEAMAAGRLTLGFVGDATRAMMPEQAPIVDTSPHAVTDTILKILDRREHYREVAALGPAFVKRWHSGAESADRLRPFLGLSA